MIRMLFFTSDAVRNYNLWSCQKVCEALTFLLDNIYIRFGSKLYRQIVGIPMGTNCAPLVADLFLAWAWLAKAKGHSCHTKKSTLAKPFTEKNE